MNVVANHLTELKSLSVEIPKTATEAFVNMTKLKKLKDLTLLGNRTFSSTSKLVELDLTHITLLLASVSIKSKIKESPTPFAFLETLIGDYPNLQRLVIDKLKHELCAIFDDVDVFGKGFAIAINGNTMKRETELLDLSLFLRD